MAERFKIICPIGTPKTIHSEKPVHLKNKNKNLSRADVICEEWILWGTVSPCGREPQTSGHQKEQLFLIYQNFGGAKLLKGEIVWLVWPKIVAKYSADDSFRVRYQRQ